MHGTAYPITHEDQVQDAWLDYNGHMNLAYYVLVFDRGTDGFLATIGMTPARREETGGSVFVAETHVTYLAEVLRGERLRVASRVLEFDAKRIHLFHTMTRAADGTEVANTELMVLHVDLDSRKVRPFPADVQERLADAARAHTDVPLPDGIGRHIAIKRGA